MDFITPESFGTILNGIKKKSDEERRELIIKNHSIITVSYMKNFDNGVQAGSIVVLGGLKAAFDKRESITPEQFGIIKELYGSDAESEDDELTDDDLNNMYKDYSESWERLLIQIISAFTNDEFQTRIFEYYLALALYGGENKAGVKNIKKIFESVFLIS